MNTLHSLFSWIFDVSMRESMERRIKAERSAAEVEKWLAGLRAKADIKRFK